MNLLVYFIYFCNMKHKKVQRTNDFYNLIRNKVSLHAFESIFVFSLSKKRQTVASAFFRRTKFEFLSLAPPNATCLKIHTHSRLSFFFASHYHIPLSCHTSCELHGADKNSHTNIYIYVHTRRGRATALCT